MLEYMVWLTFFGGALTTYLKSRQGGVGWFLSLLEAVSWPFMIGEWIVMCLPEQLFYCNHKEK